MKSRTDKTVRLLLYVISGGERNLCVKGNIHSARMIADRLNREGISTPRFYHYEKEGKTNPLSEQKNVWGSATITQLLKNQAYIGNMVQGKRQVVSFKTKKMRTVSPENWIVVENTHEPLVEKELWDRVQEKFNRHHHTVVRRTKNDMIGLYSGLIKCADCGTPLAYMRKQLKSCEKGVLSLQ